MIHQHYTRVKRQPPKQVLVAGNAHLKAQQGIALLESLIAVVLFSMGILALVGLQAAMINNTSSARYRSDASYITQQTLGELWADPKNLADYAETDAPLDALPNGTRTVSFPGGVATGQVLIVIEWRAPDDTETHNVTTNARIAGAE